MLKKISSILLLCQWVLVSVSQAAPLGTIPTVEDRNLRFIFDFRSDLWSSPYSYKSSPVRLLQAEVRVPLYRDHEWSISLDASDESLSLGRAEFQLGKESIFLSNALLTQSIGLGAKKDFANGSSLSVFSSYATASDEPYGADRDTWIDSTVIYQSHKIENHRWLIAADQSKNRGIANGRIFPYVGVIYEPESDFQAVFGFPFLQLSWGHPENRKILFHLTPFGSRLELEKKLPDDFVGKVRLGMTLHSYLHKERLDEDDRLYFQEVSITGQIRKNVTSTTGILFGLGYAFERHLYETEVVYSPNSKMIRFDNDFFGRLAMEFRL